jgi:predicted DCC family thiol-disulfide oxidoreductase YuxK
VTTSRVPILIYDGDCGFCTSVAAGISHRWRVPAETRAWQSLGEDGLAELGLTPEAAQQAAWWVDADGRRFRGHRAVAKALLGARGWRRMAGGAILLPPVSWAAAVGYRVVVRYRHRLPGSTNACSTP